MSSEHSTAYNSFWDKLLPSYTVSKGSMRLPIATTLTELPQFNHADFLEELQAILQTLLDTQGSFDQAVSRAGEAGESHIIPLITDEYTGVVRFDCIWNPEGEEVKILEINCDYPDGIILHDATYGIFTGETCSIHKDLISNLFEGDKHVHVLHSKEAVFLDSYYAEKRHLSKHIKTTIGTDLENIGPDTTVRRCLESTKLSNDDLASLLKLSSRLVNTMALRTLGYKNLLENIKHPFVPKTVSLSKATKEYCLSNQNNLVIKPANGCEGYGIYFGNNISSDKWVEMIDSKLKSNYIAQEFVEIPKLTMSLYENESIVTKNLFFDLCPHFFIKNSKIIGSGHTLMRFSENKIVNVTQGGGIGYHKL